MEQPDFVEQPPRFEVEIGYSSRIIWFDALIGMAVLLVGTAFMYRYRPWWGAAVPLYGLYCLWQAHRRRAAPGPQLKLGSHGIWTAETGFLSWAKAHPRIKTETGYRSSTTYLVILDRAIPARETTLAKLCLRELAIDEQKLQAHLTKYAPQ